MVFEQLLEVSLKWFVACKSVRICKNCLVESNHIRLFWRLISEWTDRILRLVLWPTHTHFPLNHKTILKYFTISKKNKKAYLKNIQTINIRNVPISSGLQEVWVGNSSRGLNSMFWLISFCPERDILVVQ